MVWHKMSSNTQHTFNLTACACAQTGSARRTSSLCMSQVLAWMPTKGGYPAVPKACFVSCSCLQRSGLPQPAGVKGGAGPVPADRQVSRGCHRGHASCSCILAADWQISRDCCHRIRLHFSILAAAMCMPLPDAGVVFAGNECIWALKTRQGTHCGLHVKAHESVHDRKVEAVGR